MNGSDKVTEVPEKYGDAEVDHHTHVNKAFQDATPCESETNENLVQEGGMAMEGTKPVQASFRKKLLIAILIYWNTSTMGMAYAQIGPVLPDLQRITGSSLQQVTWLFTGFGIGYIAGCLLAGTGWVPYRKDDIDTCLSFLYAAAQEKFNPRLVLFVCTVVTGITAGVLPWIEIIYVSVVIKVIQGITMAGQDTVGITMIFAVWREDGGSFNQFLDLAYSAGCFLSQFYTKPFLRDEKAVQMQVWGISRNASFNTQSNGTMDEFYSTDTKIHFAFSISALLSISAALPFLLLYIFKVKDPAETPSDIEDKTESVSLPARSLYAIFGIFFITSFITNACIETFPTLLTTFVLQQLRWTQQNASTLTAVYFAMNGVGNVIGMFVLKYSTTNKLIVASYTGAILSLIGCMTGSLLDQTSVVWVTIIIIGVSMASIIPSLYIWIEEHVTHVTGRITSCILLFGAVGQMVNPILLGYLMEKQSPMWFVNITLGGIVLCFLLYISSFLLVKRCSPKLE